MDLADAWSKILAQVALGPRGVGSPGHSAAHGLLASWLSGADLYREHTFSGRFFGKDVTCRNLWGRYLGDAPGRLLLGSHFDTRPWADCDPDPAQQREPVPGANDGASGVALLAALAADLQQQRQRPTVDIVFFDAEDWHDIDGHAVSLGSRRFAADLSAADRPDGVVIVDMIAGANLMLDVDVNCQAHPPSYDLTLQLFQLGHRLGLPACSLHKPEPYKWIGCDHSPFCDMGIPSALLIDIDYPQWHTVSDLPEACSQQSMAQISTLLNAFIFGAPGFMR